MSSKKANMLLMDEISSLSNKITDMEEQLKSEQDLNAKLLKEAADKSLTLERLHRRGIDEQDKHKSSVAAILTESAQLEADMKAKIKELRDAEREIATELAAIDIIINENELLHDRLKRLVVEHVRLKQKCEEENTIKRQKNFDLKTTMETILRAQIREFNQDQEAVAFVAIESEADAATSENGRLLEELQATTAKSMHLMQSHRGTLANLVESKLREEVQLENYRLQEKHVETLQHETDVQEMKLSRLLGMHEDVRSDFDASRIEYIRRRELLHIVQEKTKQMERAVNKHTKLKQSVVESIKGMINDSMESMRRDREHSMKSILHAAEQMMYIGTIEEEPSVNVQEGNDKERRAKSSSSSSGVGSRTGTSASGREGMGRRCSSRSMPRTADTGAYKEMNNTPPNTTTNTTIINANTTNEFNEEEEDDSKLWSNKHSSSYSNKIRARMNMSFSVSKKLV